MPGKLGFGTQFGNAGAGRLSANHAYCEGLQYRSLGTIIEQPLAGNPHEAGSEDYEAWDRGWTVANSVVGGTVAPSSAPSCAVPQNVIQA